MARYKLRKPGQPFAVRVLLGLYEFCSSLKLAVILIFACAVTLGWATFVESAYGTPAVQFGIYGTWWFTALCALLAVNIFCAASIRYPWKRHQTGFVITHIGLLTLLFGTLLSRQYGVDAQMPIWEGQSAHIGFPGTESFEIAVRKSSDVHGGNPHNPHAEGGRETVIRIPFRPGPFNWDDYDRKDWLPPLHFATNSEGQETWDLEWDQGTGLFWFPWGLAHRDRGLIYDKDGIRLEVLDYYANAEQVTAPRVDMSFTAPARTETDRDGRQRQVSTGEMPVAVEVTEAGFGELRSGLGKRAMAPGGYVVMLLATTESATKAFLESAITEPATGRGEVVLFAGGKRFAFKVDEKVGAGRFAIEGTPLEVEVVRSLASARPRPDEQQETLIIEESPDSSELDEPAVELNIYSGDDPPQRVVLFANSPELNLYDYAHGVFGTYWCAKPPAVAGEGAAPAEGMAMGRPTGRRIDVLQGHDEKLYYRLWDGQKVTHVGPLPADGEWIDGFAMAGQQLRFNVDRFVPAERPGAKIVPLPFRKGKRPVDVLRAAQVRLTVDGRSEEFWLLGGPPREEGAPLSRAERHTLASDSRLVTLTMPLDKVELGFSVKLNDFEMKLDPGTSQASDYSSYVDFVNLNDASHRYRSNELITMNAPVDFVDPTTRRSYRLFQESYAGPFVPGDDAFEANVADGDDRDHQYSSTLTIHADPGRGVRGTGCFLVVVGIATMFYMRAYFFKPQAAPTQASKHSAGGRGAAGEQGSRRGQPPRGKRKAPA